MSELYHVNSIKVDPTCIIPHQMVEILDHIGKGSRLFFYGISHSDVPFKVLIFDRNSDDDYIFDHLSSEHGIADDIVNHLINSENVYLEMFLNKFANVPDSYTEYAARKGMLRKIKADYETKSHEELITILMEQVKKLDTCELAVIYKEKYLKLC